MRPAVRHLNQIYKQKFIKNAGAKLQAPQYFDFLFLALVAGLISKHGEDNIYICSQMPILKDGSFTQQLEFFFFSLGPTQ